MRREPLVLRVFISSPGDCSEERLRIEEVLRNFSRSREAKSLNIRLEPILWERFPPGPAEPADFQVRINRLLAHYGVSTYEIYLGMMKGRLGTPTPRFASGTVEEFEAAWEQHRRKRIPEEVLFYFLDYGNTPEDGVIAFRNSLRQRGFLPSSSRSVSELEQNAYYHLARIAAEWRHWRNVARRRAKNARPGLAAFLALSAAIGFWWFWKYDLGGAQRVRDALAENGLYAAAETYASRSPYMLTQRAAVRDEINRRFAAEAAVGGSLVRFEMFERWSSQPARMDELVESVRRKIARDALAELDDRVYKLEDGTPVYLVRRAIESGVWKPGSEEVRRAIQAVAARAMLQSLASTGADPFERREGYLRNIEAEAVEGFARQAIRRRAMTSWTSREARIGAAALASDWDGLEQMASDAVRRNEPPMKEALTLVGHEPEGRVEAWLAKTMQDAPPYATGAIFEVARRRDSIGITFSFLDLLAQGKLDLSGGIKDDIARELVSRPRQEMERAAAERLRRTLNGGLGRETMSLLIPVADVSDWTAHEKARAAEVIVSLLQGKNDLPPQTYVLLARLGSESGLRILERTTQDYIEERISFGIAVKAALVDAWAILNDPQAMDRARKLLEIAEREQSGFRGDQLYAPDSWPVAAAYLRAAKALDARFVGVDREIITRLSQQRISHPPGAFTIEDVDLAFGSYLSGLKQNEWLALLALPTDAITDEFDGKWELRNYLVQTTISTGGKIPAEVLNAMLLRMPFESPLREKTAAILARSDLAAVTHFLQREAERDSKGKKKNMELLKSLQHESTTIVPPITAAELRKGLPESRAEGARILLQRAASTPGLDWSPALGSPDVQRALRELLTKADLADWVFLCQEFPEAKSRAEAFALLPLMQSRTAFWIVEAPTTNLTTPAFRVDGKIAMNTLAESVATSSSPEVWQALYTMQIGAGSPEVLGTVGNPRAVYRGLLLWLAAPSAKGNVTWRQVNELLPLLDDNDPSLVRGVAAVLLHWVAG
jgi:hypothetical protein